jgi:hypothetical protein
MPGRLFTCCLVFVLLAAPGPGFIRPAAGTVTGYVNPPEAALRAWIFSGTDTLTATVETSGHFQMAQVKPGNYHLLVEAKPPYRNSVREGIRVADGVPTDVGTIEMQR